MGAHSMKSPSLFTLFFLASFFNQTASAQSSLIIKNTWVAEAPPVSKVMAAYMEIENPSDQSLTIISATSDSFEQIEFHQSQHINNIASMKRMHRLVIPANGKLELKAGGHHMMLFKPVKKLKSGDHVSFSFKQENGNIVTVDAPVKKQDFNSSSNEHQSHEHH